MFLHLDFDMFLINLSNNFSTLSLNDFSVGSGDFAFEDTSVKTLKLDK